MADKLTLEISDCMTLDVDLAFDEDDELRIAAEHGTRLVGYMQPEQVVRLAAVLTGALLAREGM